MQKSGWVTVVAAIGLGLLSGCQPATTPEHSAQPRPVKLFSVGENPLQQIRQFPALVEPTENARLTFRVAGRLQKLTVRPGQQVQQNEMLAQLEPTDFKLKLEQASARYQLAKAQYERADKLLAQKLMSQAQFDEVKAQLQVADADLKTSQTNLSYTELRAPFSGTIARLLVENHENVAAQQAILELQLRDMVDVVIQVPEDVIALVRKDASYQPEVVFDSYPAQKYRATIKEWDTRADAATNSFKVVFSLPAPKEFNVLSGMTANVVADLGQLTRQQQPVLTVPASAVFVPADKPLDGDRYVWVYQPAEGIVSRRPVVPGKLSGERLEIISGLSGGEQVVSAGVHQLSEGQAVRPWQRERGL